MKTRFAGASLSLTCQFVEEMLPMIDILLLAVIVGVAWCVASEGAWGAAQTCLSVFFAGLLAMNFFEPLADSLQDHIAPSWAHRWDVISLVGLFGLFIYGLRSLGNYLSPTFIQVQSTVHEAMRWSCGLLTGYVTMAFLLTALHTMPLSGKLIGFKPEPEHRSGPLSSLAPDYQWLEFTQYVSEYAFRQGCDGRVFDPKRYASRRVRPAPAQP